ncbi:hypothetical protein SAMN05421595_2135 [Austwickia chelonae]|nr:hypothetical protein SAMN05421595_2135 [Austwickia chelonae]
MPGVFTQAKRLAEVLQQVADAVRTWLEDPGAQIIVRMPPEFRE